MWKDVQCDQPSGECKGKSQCSIITYLSERASEVKVVQSCPTLCDPMDYTVHGILQARILEWVTFPFSRGSFQARDHTQVSRTAGRFFTSWATAVKKVAQGSVVMEDLSVFIVVVVTWNYTFFMIQLHEATHTHTHIHTTHELTAFIIGEIWLNFMVHINVDFRLLQLYHSYAKC